MQEFNHGSQLQVIVLLVAGGLAGKQNQQRAQAFTAAFDNVLGDFLNQWDIGSEPLDDKVVNAAEIIRYGVVDALGCHRAGKSLAGVFVEFSGRSRQC